MQEDVFDLVSYVSDFLDIVEDRFRLPHQAKYPLSRSANYSQFALLCIMDYAEMHQLSELYDRSREAYKRDEPYWDRYSLEVP